MDERVGDVRRRRRTGGDRRGGHLGDRLRCCPEPTWSQETYNPPHDAGKTSPSTTSGQRPTSSPRQRSDPAYVSDRGAGGRALQVEERRWRGLPRWEEDSCADQNGYHPDGGRVSRAAGTAAWPSFASDAVERCSPPAPGQPPPQNDRDLADLPAKGGDGDDVAHPLGAARRELGAPGGWSASPKARRRDTSWRWSGTCSSSWSKARTSGGPFSESLVRPLPTHPGYPRSTPARARRDSQNPTGPWINTTIWTGRLQPATTSRALLFDVTSPGANSVANWYIEQSSNRYTVNGDVTDWRRFPTTRGSLRTRLLWWHRCKLMGVRRRLMDAWYDAQISAGMTPAEIDAYLARFDVWDRYD